MSLWGSIDQAANAPKWTTFSGISATANLGSSTISPNGQITFANNVPSTIHSNVGLSVLGVTAAEKASLSGPAHAGWVNKVEGTGPVASITVTDGGTGYSGNGFITFIGGGTANNAANAAYTVNGGGSIASVTLVSGGANYNAATVTANAVATYTTPAVFVITKGGRAGRVQYETLVAQGSIA
jgi:hypothetical protein